MVSLEDVQEKVELNMGGGRIFPENVKEGDYILVIKSDGLHVYGFHINRTSRVSIVPTLKRPGWIGERKPCSKVVFKNLRVYFHATCEEFLKGRGNLVVHVQRSRGGGFVDFYSDDPFYKGYSNTELIRFLEGYLG